MRIAVVSVSILAVGLALTACSVSSTSSPSSGAAPYGKAGKQGKIGFSYGGTTSASDECPLLGCAMMQGTDEEIFMSPDAPLDAVFESSDPAVITVDSDGRVNEGDADGGLKGILDIHVKAVGAGTAELRVKSASGAIVDSIDLVVAVPARIEIDTSTGDAGIAASSTTSMQVGATINAGGTAYDANGKRLAATNGWTLVSDAPSIASAQDACGLICFATDQTFTIDAIAAGTAHATMTGGGVSQALAITVTP